MPNQNATKFKGKDPDPTDFLWPTMDMKKQNLQKPYVSQSMGLPFKWLNFHMLSSRTQRSLCGVLTPRMEVIAREYWRPVTSRTQPPR